MDSNKAKPKLLPLEESFEVKHNKLFTKNISSNCRQLFKMRKDFLAMNENQLVENYKRIIDFNEDMKSDKDYALNSKLENVFFLKIALDKDYPILLKNVIDNGIKLEYWKINYLPVIFYLAEVKYQLQE